MLVIIFEQFSSYSGSSMTLVIVFEQFFYLCLASSPLLNFTIMNEFSYAKYQKTRKSFKIMHEIFSKILTQLNQILMQVIKLENTEVI